ncbi:MAG: hypothetical protein HQL19_01550 [Candidatus Omnitrophica bacterium]|nr:hypothetical protein [Candidatus Omnitrophota bacterium]
MSHHIFLPFFVILALLTAVVLILFGALTIAALPIIFFGIINNSLPSLEEH